MILRPCWNFCPFCTYKFSVGSVGKKRSVTSLQGLVVPVIRNVEEMNYADIEKAINALGEKVSV